MRIFVLKRLFEALICLCGIMSDPAVLSVSHVLMPDGAAQTTSQLTFSNVADIANGQTLQNFMRGHLALHMESVQQQGALPRPSLHADRYSRPIDNSSAAPGRSDEDDDETWGSWTSAPNQTGDTRRPNEPLGAPAGNVVPMFNLTRITRPPLLGEHCFVLRSRLSIRETAARIHNVQYYTLPSTAQLQLPAGIVLKGSWESIYRGLLPFRDAIIDDGQWTDDMLGRIAQHFRSSPRDLPPQLSVQLGLLETCWPYARKTRMECLHIDSQSKHGSNNKFAVLFHFEPRRAMPTNLRAHAVRSFQWAHNTDVRAVINSLKNKEPIRPSKWCDEPLPDADCANWSPPTGFFCRGSFDPSLHATHSAARHGGITSSRPWCIGGTSLIRQQHVLVSRGGVLADTAAAHFHNLVHSREGGGSFGARWRPLRTWHLW